MQCINHFGVSGQTNPATAAVTESVKWCEKAKKKVQTRGKCANHFGVSGQTNPPTVAVNKVV